MSALAVLLCAAAPNTHSRPLIVPPPAMHEIKPDAHAIRLLHGMDRARIISEYIGTARSKVAGVQYVAEIMLATGKVPSNLRLSAEDYGKSMLQLLSKNPRLTSVSGHPMQLCNSTAGWFLTLSTAHKMVTDIAYAAAADGMYMAILVHPAVLPDPLGARTALSTLCPANREASYAAPATQPFVVPEGWAAADPAAAPSELPIVTKGLWLLLGTGAPAPDSLRLGQAPSLSAEDSPDARIDLIVAEKEEDIPGFKLRVSRAVKLCNGSEDGWYLQYERAGPGQYTSVVEQMYAFGAQRSLFLTYARTKNRPENAPARGALDTLCAAGSGSAA